MTTLTEPRQTIAKAGRLINLILKRLVPMLLDATDGDAQAARALAIETVNDYAARNNADLLAIAQIIACGLASLGNLSLSMTGDIPHALMLRLQAAANALDRTAQQNRRVLRQAPPAQTDFCYDPGPEDAAQEAAALAALAEAQQALAQAQAEHAAAQATAVSRQDPEPQAQRPVAQAQAQHAAVNASATPAPPHPAPTVPDATVPDLTDREKAVIWAGGMNRVAAEYATSIPHLPPAQRRGASLRAQVLSTTASALIAGTPLEPFRLPKKPKTA